MPSYLGTQTQFPVPLSRYLLLGLTKSFLTKYKYIYTYIYIKSFACKSDFKVIKIIYQFLFTNLFTKCLFLYLPILYYFFIFFISLFTNSYFFISLFSLFLYLPILPSLFTNFFFTNSLFISSFKK